MTQRPKDPRDDFDPVAYLKGRADSVIAVAAHIADQELRAERIADTMADLDRPRRRTHNHRGRRVRAVQ